MTNRRDDIRWLQGWYIDQCNGDWEHQYGVKIDTLDNPGWTLKIDLQGTPLENKSLTSVDIHRSEHDWVDASVKDRKFEGACGPDNLVEIIRLFRIWATEEPAKIIEEVQVRAEEKRRIAQEAISKMLIHSQINGFELRDKYTLFFYNEELDSEHLLTTEWNFHVFPTVLWPETLGELQKKTLEIQRLLSQIVVNAECLSDGGLTIEFHRGTKLQILPAPEHPSINQIWTLMELGATVAEGGTKIVVDAEGGFTIWSPAKEQGN